MTIHVSASEFFRDAHALSVVDEVTPFAQAGFAIHWLHARDKRPIGDGWSSKPVATPDSLRATYQDGNNAGVRLGDVSRVDGGYLHVIDMDIRDPKQASAAWSELRALFPTVDIDTLPMVQSGSGGESRHLYLISDKPFSSKKLAHSGVYVAGEDGKRHLTWEIELFGSGKQVAMPPSIHPSGNPYVWLRPFDLDALDLGIAPLVSSDAIEDALPDDDFEPREGANGPCTDLDDDKVKGWLLKLDDGRWATYESWMQIGAALHHQYEGGQRGLEIYEEISCTKPNYKRGETRKKWKSFGRNRRLRHGPVTMRAVMEWAKSDYAEATFGADAFDDDITSDPVIVPEPDDEFDALFDEDDEGETSFDDVFSADDDDSPEAAQAALLAQAKAAGGSGSWISLLHNGDKGLLATLHNVELILKNDARLVGLPQINEFTQEVVQRQSPGEHRRSPKRAKPTRQLGGRVWEVKDKLNGDLWSDDRDFAIRSIIEAPTTQGGYGIKISDRDLKAATALAANDNPFHPVREYLDGLVWDGIPRVDALFIDYLGASDTAYTREVARLMMIAAVTRVFEPGAKWDHAIILEGLQGVGKSTFIRALAKFWFTELDADFNNTQQLVELMQGKWIIELPELSAFSKSDVKAIKAFITRQTDRVRLAYARRAMEFPRQSIFIGSTNDRQYLQDLTGGRRFFPIACERKAIDVSRLRENVDQLWAEARAAYQRLRDEHQGDIPLYLTSDDAISEAGQLQESRRTESVEEGYAGRIAAWLEAPIVTGDISAVGEATLRERVCLQQIWTEALGRDMASYKHADAQALGRAMGLLVDWRKSGSLHNFASPYGRQRYFERVRCVDENRGA